MDAVQLARRVNRFRRFQAAVSPWQQIFVQLIVLFVQLIVLAVWVYMAVTRPELRSQWPGVVIGFGIAWAIRDALALLKKGRAGPQDAPPVHDEATIQLLEQKRAELERLANGAQ